MRGFTLVEVVIVMAIMLIVFFASLPIYQSLISYSQLSIAKKELIQTLNISKYKAIYSYNNSKHGVYVSGTEYIYYQGEDYLTRNQLQDITYEFPENVEVGINSDVNFEKNTGFTSSALINLIDVNTGDLEEVLVTNFGGIH